MSRPRACLLAALFALLLSIFGWLHLIGSWGYLVALALAVTWCLGAGRIDAYRDKADPSWLAAAALLSACFFRLSYLQDVQLAADWGETWIFFQHATDQLANGLSFKPYHHYFHTLYGYLMAVGMSALGDYELGFRVASALISIATAVFFYLSQLALFGRRAAWISTALFAASFWHLWASRVGGHKFLLPLFQALFMWAFARGARSGGARWHLLAALAMAGGLYSYWGFYYMPLVWLLMLAALPGVEAHRRRGLRRAGALAMAGALAACVPLLHFFYTRPNLVNYPLGKLKGERAAVEISELASRVSRNLDFTAWAFSGNRFSGGLAEFAPFVELLVAAAATLGFGLALLGCRRSFAHAALLLNFAIGFLGVNLTHAHNQYIIALMWPIYSLAGLGLAYLATELEDSFASAGRLALPALALALAAQSFANYGVFFGDRLLSDLKSPYEAIGTNHPLPGLLRDLAPRRAIFVPLDQPGRGLGGGLRELRELGFPEYGFVAELKDLENDKIFFPADEIGSKSGAAIVLPNLEPALAQLEALRKLYPHARVTEVYPPEPYLTRYPRAMALILEIENEELERYRLGGGPAPEGRALFLAERSGAHAFSRGLAISGRELAANEPRFLEAGLHEISFEGDASGLEARGPGGVARPASRSAFVAGGLDRAWLAPYLAPAARPAGFRYVRSHTLQLGKHPNDIALTPANEIALFDGLEVLLLDLDGRELARHAAAIDRFSRIGSTQGRTLLVQPDGKIWRVASSGLEAEGQLGCRMLDVNFPAGFAACEDRIVPISSGADTISFGSGYNPQALLGSPERLLILDFDGSRLLSVQNSGRLTPGRMLDFWAWPLSGSAVDAAGNSYLMSRGREQRILAPDLSRLYDPGTLGPALLLDERLKPIMPDRIAQGAAERLAGLRGPEVWIFERRVSGPSEPPLEAHRNS